MAREHDPSGGAFFYEVRILKYGQGYVLVHLEILY